MRLAWFGPTPTEDGGVSYAATQLLQAMSELGVEVDCYLSAAEEDVPRRLHEESNLRFVCIPPHWHWDRWYSRHEISAFVTGQAMRMVAQSSLAKRAGRENQARRYTCVYQFSQIESSALAHQRDRLPPLVLHPQVHAQGELRWHRLEAPLGRRCESLPRFLAARQMLVARSQIQRRQIGFAAGLVAPSDRFATHLASDYRYPRARIVVIPNPIDLRRFRPSEPGGERSKRQTTLLFVSRMSVRKGVEMIVDLSHRLTDLEGAVALRAVGNHTLWSDYRCLLSDLNPGVARYDGPGGTTEVTAAYRSADIVLQPSHYEPFALTVAEALSSGKPVVVSSEVGAREGVSTQCCRVFPAGDADAFERRVRELVDELSLARAEELRMIARRNAERLFSPSAVGDAVVRGVEAFLRRDR